MNFVQEYTPLIIIYKNEMLVYMAIALAPCQQTEGIFSLELPVSRGLSHSQVYIQCVLNCVTYRVISSHLTNIFCNVKPFLVL